MELDGVYLPAEMIREILDRFANVICRKRICGLRRVSKLFDYLVCCLYKLPILCSTLIADSTVPHSYVCPEYDHWRSKYLLDYSHSLSNESTTTWIPRPWKKSTPFVMDELY